MLRGVERLPGSFICDHWSDERCRYIRFGQERQNILLQYRRLSAQVNAKCPVNPDPISSSALVNSAQNPCRAGKACVAWLAHKPLAWTLLHLDVITKILAEAEIALVGIYTENELDADVLKTDFERALQKDYEDLKTWLSTAESSDAAVLASMLQSNEYGNPYQVKELTTAFTKRVRSFEQKTTEDKASQELNAFLRLVAHALQRLSGRSSDYEIPSWSVRSLDVDFHAEDDRVLGRGAFARVVEGTWDGKLVAVKELSLKVDYVSAHDTIRHEVQIWSRLSHPNILPFYGACLEASQPFIISQICTAGNVLQYLQQCLNVRRINLLRDVSVGMIYLHEQGIIHADLKAANILIGDTGEALIADFGLSQVQDQVSSSVHVTRTSADKVGGTFRWMAPEVLEGRGLNKPADIYGFSLTAWELYVDGAVPFGTVVDTQQFLALVKKGERPERPPLIEEGLWGLVQRCWRSDPCERPNFIEVERTLGELMPRSDQETTHQVSDDKAVSQGPVLSPSTLPASSCTSNVDGPCVEQPPPPLIIKTRKLPISAETDTKTSFLKGLVSKKIPAFSRSPEVACITSKSRDVDKQRMPGDELAFIHSARKIPSLSRLLADSLDPLSMDLVLALLYNHSLKADASGILNEGSLLPAVINRLEHPKPPENEKYLMSGLLANLACQRDGRAKILAQPNAISALRALLAPAGPMLVQENTSRCLYNLSTDDVSHRLLVRSNETVASLGRLLSVTSSLSITKNILGCLTNLSHKEPGRSSIISATEAIDALIQTLGMGEEDIIMEQALMCLGNLSVDEGVTALLANSELIPGLAMCLCHETSASAIKAQTLRCFRNLAKSAASHPAIRNRPVILAAICDVLAVRASTNQQKYALHFLHRFTSSEVGKAWLRTETRIFKSLQWFSENGSLEEQSRVADCLDKVQDLL